MKRITNCPFFALFFVLNVVLLTQNKEILFLKKNKKDVVLELWIKKKWVNLLQNVERKKN